VRAIAGRPERPDHGLEAGLWIAAFHLRHSGLARADAFGELGLREARFDAPLPDRGGDRDPGLDHSHVLVFEVQKLLHRGHAPAELRQLLLFLRVRIFRQEQPAHFEFDRLERGDACRRGIVVRTELAPAAVAQCGRFEHAGFWIDQHGFA
jgi:hypothetical protein